MKTFLIVELILFTFNILGNFSVLTKDVIPSEKPQTRKAITFVIFINVGLAAWAFSLLKGIW